MTHDRKYRIKYQYGIWSIVDKDDKILANWRDENSAKEHLKSLKKMENK
jgi:hypothetical protein